jgi:hypothetical protein
MSQPIPTLHCRNRGRRRRLLTTSTVAIGLLALSGCGSDTKTDKATRSDPTPRATANVTVSPLVGTWQRVNSCESFVRAFRQAGLQKLAPEWLAGGGYFKRAAEIDEQNPCRGATEVEHSHFFTKDGRFGSNDQNGEQVDDGDYNAVNDTTLAFPSHEKEFGREITVRYRIEGDTLNFAVVVPDPCTRSCRIATAWAISAFYPGPFTRVK